LVSPEKHIRAQAFARTYRSDSYRGVFVFHTTTTHAGHLRLQRILPISSPPQHTTFPLSLSVTRCGFLEYNFDLINSWCSAPRLFLALTQTATNW
ncbi:unnamed protein product, partial [Hymenolepis diminuta]